MFQGRDFGTFDDVTPPLYPSIPRLSIPSPTLGLPKRSPYAFQRSTANMGWGNALSHMLPQTPTLRPVDEDTPIIGSSLSQVPTLSGKMPPLATSPSLEPFEVKDGIFVLSPSSNRDDLASNANTVFTMMSILVSSSHLSHWFLCLSYLQVGIGILGVPNAFKYSGWLGCLMIMVNLADKGLSSFRAGIHCCMKN